MSKAIRILGAAAVVLGLLLPVNSLAAEHEQSESPAMSFDYLAGIGFMFGGDTIATYVTTFPPGSTLAGETANLDVKGGNGGYYFIGAGATWPRQNLALELHWGLFKDSVGDAGRFSRLATELMLFTELGRWRLGAGAMHHGSPEFKDDDLGNLEFDDATGWLVQLDYHFDVASIGVRHGNIDYELGDSSLNGDHWGIIGTLHFGD